MKRAFTLIELLIVVAIIAILAAIAVPNFLEAQVRAKVARVKSDIRSVTTGLESYCVDHGKYPLGKNASFALGLSGEDAHLFGYTRLTTPIAYITTIPVDPFLETGDAKSNRAGAPPNYQTFGLNQWNINDAEGLSDYGNQAVGYGYRWALYSNGPDREAMLGRVWHILRNHSDPSRTSKSFAYDATNGTRSKGFILRTNKGDFPD